MATDPLIGTKMGDYVVESLLGRGGMARVYKGYDANLDRHAAVKVIDSHLINSDERDEYYERFQREARAIARLRHPNIVGVYQFGQVDEQYYMAMVFIKGRDLRYVLKDHVKAGTMMAPPLVLKIMRAMTSALDYAHEQGVIHRDIKPSNILVTDDGTAILTDFGLALNTSDGTIGNTFGSAHYIAPEQAVSSAHAVAQSDMYSLGICLYEMLTGSVPFDDASAMSVALKHLSDPPPPPSHLNPSIPPEVEDVMIQVLEKEPEDRYESCGDFMQALEAAFDEAAVVDERPTESDVRADASIPRPVDMPAQPRPVNASEDSIPSALSSQARRSRASRSRASRVQRVESTTSRLRESQEAEQIGNNNRLPLLIAVGVGVMVLIGGALLFLSLGGEATPDPTATSVVAAEVTTTSIPDATMTTTPEADPTATPEVDPTATPTETEMPTDTPLPPTPTSVPDTATAQAPTTSPVGGIPEGTIEVQLIYDEASLVLHNTSDMQVDISDLRFYQPPPDPDDFPITVAISRIWGRGAVPPNRVPPGDCFQVWSRDRFSRLGSPPYCSRQGFYGVVRNNDFWVAKDDVAVFELRLDGETLAVCEIDAGTCTVPVPLAN